MYNIVEVCREYTKFSFPNHMYLHVNDKETVNSKTAIHLSEIQASYPIFVNSPFRLLFKLMRQKKRSLRLGRFGPHLTTSSTMWFIFLL